MKKNNQTILLLVILCFLFLYIIFHTESMVDEVICYLSIFFYHLFPTSFLFLLLSSLLMEYQVAYFIQRITRSKNLSSYIFFMSLLGGFPSGAILVKSFFDKGLISLQDANKMIQYAHFPNPLFIFHMGFLIFQSKKIMITFYSILILSNFILYLFYYKNTSSYTLKYMPVHSFSKVFQKCLFETIRVLIIIFGTSLFFYLCSCIVRNYFNSNSFLYVFCSGLFDLTNGVLSTSILSNTFIQGILLFFFIAFGSISIHIQVKSILEDTSISYSSFLKGRVLSFIFCVILWVIYLTITIR